MRPDEVEIKMRKCPLETYLGEVRAARAAVDFRALAQTWGEMFADAAVAALRVVADGDVKRTVELIRLETAAGRDRRRKSPLEDDPSLASHPFMDLLMPNHALQAGMMSSAAKVPWTLAYCRLRDLGMLPAIDGQVAEGLA